SDLSSPHGGRKAGLRPPRARQATVTFSAAELCNFYLPNRCRVHRLIHRLIRKGNRVSNRVSNRESNKVAVKAFIRVLVARDLPESAKLVWLLLKLDQLDQLDRGLTTKALLSPTRIQRQIGLSRPTIRKAIAHLRAKALLTVNGRLPLPGDFPYD